MTAAAPKAAPASAASAWVMTQRQCSAVLVSSVAMVMAEQPNHGNVSRNPKARTGCAYQLATSLPAVCPAGQGQAVSRLRDYWRVRMQTNVTSVSPMEMPASARTADNVALGSRSGHSTSS